MSWYLESGQEPDVVISSRIRLARNIETINFVNKYNTQDVEKVIESTIDACRNISENLKSIKLKDMDNITKLSLIEKHIISPEFAVNTEKGVLLISEEENIAIMLNEEDHIRIQVLSAGINLDSLYNLADKIDNDISKKIHYAYHTKYGFLTSCPTNAGTGLRASVMVHLPALTITKNINRVLEVVNNVGMNIRGIYGEGTESQGNIYQISNKTSLGISEKEIIKNITVISEKIVEQERLARKHLLKDSTSLEDKICRSYGILTYAKKISSSECSKLLSDVKLGVDLGIIKDITNQQINKLSIYVKTANLQKYLAKELNEQERDIQRAKLIKNIIRKG